MDEDELVRRLKKADFEKMRDLFAKIHSHALDKDIETAAWVNLRNIAAKRHGWTVVEWQRENSRRISKLISK